VILCVAPSLDHRIHLIYASVTAKGSSTCFAWPRPVTQRIHLFFSLIAVSNLAISPSSILIDHPPLVCRQSHQLPVAPSGCHLLPSLFNS
jgi:hypothetical protein